MKTRPENQSLADVIPLRPKVQVIAKTSDRRPARVLVIEHSRKDAGLVCGALKSGAAPPKVTVAASVTEAREHIHIDPPDLAIVTSRLPDGTPTDLLAGPCDFPVVVLSDDGNIREAVEAMRAGAVDVVAKSQVGLDDLPAIAARALREWEKSRAHHRADQLRSRMANLVLALPDFVAIAHKHGRLVFVNGAGRDIFGLDADEDVACYSIHDFFPEWKVAALVTDGIVRPVEDLVWTRAPAKTRDGGCKTALQTVFAHVARSGDIQYYTVLARDFSDRKHPGTST